MSASQVSWLVYSRLHGGSVSISFVHRVNSEFSFPVFDFLCSYVHIHTSLQDINRVDPSGFGYGMMSNADNSKHLFLSIAPNSLLFSILSSIIYPRRDVVICSIRTLKLLCDIFCFQGRETLRRMARCSNYEFLWHGPPAIPTPCLELQAPSFCVRPV